MLSLVLVKLFDTNRLTFHMSIENMGASRRVCCPLIFLKYYCLWRFSLKNVFHSPVWTIYALAPQYQERHSGEECCNVTGNNMCGKDFLGIALLIMLRQQQIKLTSPCLREIYSQNERDSTNHWKPLNLATNIYIYIYTHTYIGIYI